MTRYTIRPATEKDLDALVRHRRKMWEDIDGHSEDRLDAHDRLYRRWARQRLRSGRFFAWVAANARGEIAASGAVWLQDTQPHPRIGLGPVPYLLSMYTEPAHRGHRLATRIVQEAMKWAKGEGFGRMTLHASIQGRNVYRRLGWERTWEMRVRTEASKRR